MGQWKKVKKHGFQQATALSWGYLGSSEHPAPIPAGMSQNDSGPLSLLSHWASAEKEELCCLAEWVLSVCPSLYPTIISQLHLKLFEFRGVCTMATPSGSKGAWQSLREAAALQHSHLSTGQGHNRKYPGSGQAREASSAQQQRDTSESLRPCLMSVWRQAGCWLEMLLSRHELQRMSWSPGVLPDPSSSLSP